jgi:hypothetical protein
VQIATENNRQEIKTISHTAVEITILITKKGNEDTTEEVGGNLQTEFQLKKSTKMLKMIKENMNKGS